MICGFRVSRMSHSSRRHLPASRQVLGRHDAPYRDPAQASVAFCPRIMTLQDVMAILPLMLRHRLVPDAVYAGSKSCVKTSEVSTLSTCHARKFEQDVRRVHCEPAKAQSQNVSLQACTSFVFHVCSKGEDYAFAFLRNLRSLWEPDGESRISDGPEAGCKKRLRMQAAGIQFPMMPGASERARHCSGLEACTCAPPSLKMPTYVSVQGSAEFCCHGKVTTQDFVESLRQRAPVGTALSIVSRHSRSSNFCLRLMKA